MNDLKQPFFQDGFAVLVKSLAEIPALLKRCETFCMQLSAQVLRNKTENFEKKTVNFEADGLVVTYHCTLDGKTYRIHISPVKEI